MIPTAGVVMLSAERPRNAGEGFLIASSCSITWKEVKNTPSPFLISLSHTEQSLLLPRGREFVFTSGKKGRGDAFPSDVVCSEQMHGPLSLWEPRSRKSDYKEFGLHFLVLSEIAVKSDLDLFSGSCDTVVGS